MPMTAAERSAICEAFELGQPLDCARLGGTRNRNFLLRTTSGRWFVRNRYAGYCEPARAAFDHAALEFLSSGHAPVVAPQRTKAGGTLLGLADGAWEVFPAVEGRHLRDADADDVRALAEALAQFHRVGRDFGGRCDKIGPRGETDPREMMRIAAMLREQNAERGTILERYEQWVKNAAAEFSDYEFQALPHTLVHGDVQPANVLINEGRVTALVDLDWCAW